MQEKDSGDDGERFWGKTMIAFSLVAAAGMAYYQLQADELPEEV
jgi:hypothetical protein